MSSTSCPACGDDDPDHKIEECRPDLYEHEIGEDCTWHYNREMGLDGPYCYAYQNPDTKEYGSEHIYFLTSSEKSEK